MRAVVALIFVTALAAGCSDDGRGGVAGASASGDDQPPDGEAIYNRYCFSCHASGVAGAPKIGSAAAWAPRVAQGRDVLIANTLRGMPPGMPAKGLCSDCDQAALAAAVDYMLARLPATK